VIGNPPYVRQEGLREFKEYFKCVQRDVYHGVADLYVYFIHKGFSLLRPSGNYSMILNNKWMRTNYGKSLQKWMKEKNIRTIIDFGDQPVFEGATTYPCIVVLNKGTATADFIAANVDTLKFESLETYMEEKAFCLTQSSLSIGSWNLTDNATIDLLEKIRNMGVLLLEYIDGRIYRGIITGLNEAFVIDKVTRNLLIAEDAKSEELIKPFLIGKDIKRYVTPRSDRFLIFTRRGIDINKYSAIKRHITSFKERLMPKPRSWKGIEWPGRKSGNYEWYEIQDTIDYYKEFERPKIIYPNICHRPEFAFDPSGYYTNQKCFIIPLDDKYLLALLNSPICNFYFHTNIPKLRGGFFEPGYVFMKDFPVIQPSENEEISREIALLANNMVTNDYSDKRKLENSINELTFKMYDLSAKEISLVCNVS